MGFFRQEYWSGLPFPSPGDLPNPGVEPGSPALQADALSSQPPGKPKRDLWHNIKHTNIRIIGVPEEEKKKGYEKIFEEIIIENFPNTEKEIVIQVQETQRVPYKINPRRNTPRHILFKLTKTQHEERILKAASEKQQVTGNGNPIC